MGNKLLVGTGNSKTFDASVDVPIDPINDFTSNGTK
jgi:hypothetical protein